MAGHRSCQCHLLLGRAGAIGMPAALGSRGRGDRAAPLLGWHNPTMPRWSPSSRFALWAAVCALLLKAAVPMLAAGAAQMRGVSVADVCTVYGVTLAGASHHEHAGHAHHHVDPSGDDDHSSHSAAEHSGDHCALTALAALAVPDTAMPAVARAYSVPSEPRVETSDTFRDACASWVAQLKHGPPVTACTLRPSAG